VKFEKSHQEAEIEALFEFGSRQEIIIVCKNFRTNFFILKLGACVDAKILQV